MHAVGSKRRAPGAPTTCHDVLKTTASVGGNVLEWLDFAVFGFFSDIIGEVFFPQDQTASSSSIESFAIFGGAFLMRPIGGIVIGYIGDIYGRKLALELSIFLMAIATFLMGSLPTYDRVGAWAIIMLLTVRLCQGLSVGGQLMSSLVYTLECHPQQRWGLYGSFVMAASNFGTLLGGVVAWFLQDVLSNEDLRAWGWRLPFWVGSVLVGLCGIYLKYFCPEDDEQGFQNSHGPVPTSETADIPSESGEADGSSEVLPDEERTIGDGLVRNAPFSDELKTSMPPDNPLKLAFARENARSLISSSLVPMLWSGGLYVSFVWMPVFIGNGELVRPTVPHAFAVNSFALLLLMVWFPIAGALSDKLSRKTVMTAGGIGMGLFGPLSVVLIVNRHSDTTMLFCQTVLGISVSLWGAPMCAWLVESFDPASRLTSVSIGYNMAQAIAGGLSPLLAEILAVEVSPTSPGVIYVVLAVLALTGLLCVAPGKIYGLRGPLTSETVGGVDTGIEPVQENNDESHSLELKEIS